MNMRTGLTVAILIAGWTATAPAFARPPTVTVSPGYDARLIESRKALAQPIAEPRPVKPHRHGQRTQRRHR
ncbi:hypothetical protein ACSVBT_16735 [Afipia sp. TerB]